MKLLVINGPNLNLLGLREPAIYGSATYAELVELLQNKAAKAEILLQIYQSNHEGAIIDTIQAAYGQIDGLIINPAAYTHTSIAISDALKAVAIPTVEVHLSDISKRESYRQHSYITETALTTICGYGFQGYIMAIDFLLKYLVAAEKCNNS